MHADESKTAELFKEYGISQFESDLKESNELTLFQRTINRGEKKPAYYSCTQFSSSTIE